MASPDGLKVGDIVLVRFEIRRAEPSDLRCYLARRAMGPVVGPWAGFYEWIPESEIVSLAPLTLPTG